MDNKARLRKLRRSRKPTCISLFSGAGGLDLGLEAVGFDNLVATDIDMHSCNTLRAGSQSSSINGLDGFSNLEVIEEDICKLSPRSLLNHAGLQKGELDLLAGGPPCQAFSVFGKRQGRDDPRGKLVFEYLRILTGLEPRAFIFENVYGLLTIENGRVVEELMARLEKPKRGLNYNLTLLRLNAVNFGVPQFRDRVFIIGCRDNVGDIKVNPLVSETQELFAQLPKWRTVRDALRGLPRIGSAKLANHVGREHSERIIQRYASLRPGQRDPLTRINKLDLDCPSFTIIVGSDKGGGKGHVHPVEPREVTPRESARIQTFPDWWAFSGTSRHPIRQVGNAVPPLLGAAVGSEMIAQIFGGKPTTLRGMVQKLSLEYLFPEFFGIRTRNFKTTKDLDLTASPETHEAVA